MAISFRFSKGKRKKRKKRKRRRSLRERRKRRPCDIQPLSREESPLPELYNFRICSILQEVVQENAEMPPVPPSTVAGHKKATEGDGLSTAGYILAHNMAFWVDILI